MDQEKTQLPNLLTNPSSLMGDDVSLSDMLLSFVGIVDTNSSSGVNVTSFGTIFSSYNNSSTSLMALFISLLIKFLAANNIFSASLGIMAMTWLFRTLHGYMMELYYNIKDLFFYSMEIQQSDSTYQYIRTWLSSLEYSKRAKNVTVHARWKNGYYSDDDDDQPAIQMIPGLGTHRFMYKNNIVWLTRDAGDKETVYNRETMTLTIFGLHGKRVLQEIISDAMQLHFVSSHEQTTVYTVCDDYADWEKCTSREHRCIDSVFLPSKVKEDLIQDVQRFLSNASWYKKNGINFKRGYLLYGPPGTGKTSSILAIAGHLNLSVCVLNLSRPNTTDNFLMKVMNKAPAKSIILLEDIDAAFNERKADGVSKDISFSGLLNALDGVASQNHGRLVFMTTNHIERLAPALVRPGRIDYRVKFTLATKDQIVSMFNKFYPEEEYAHVGEKLAEMLPSEQISPAELQRLLIAYQPNPPKVLEGVETFLLELDEERKLAEERRKKLEEDSDSKKKEE